MVTRRKGAVKSNSNNSHALLSPSGAVQWANCPASLVMKAEYPDKGNTAAKDGTAMHTLSEVILNRFIDGTTDAPESADQYIGWHVLDEGRGELQKARKKGAIKLTADMCNHVNRYIEYLTPIISCSDHFAVEQRINLTRVLDTGDQPTFGTADAEAVFPIANTGKYMLLIGDLKTGRIRVYPVMNLQLIIYALGSLRRLQRLYDIEKVRLMIYQPFAGGGSEFDMSVEDLEKVGEELRAAAALALDALKRGKKGLTADDFVPSEAACKWCRHAENCDANVRYTADIMRADLADIPAAQLAQQYNRIPMMLARIEKIQKMVYSRLINGGEVPGLKLVLGSEGRRSWADEDKVIALLKKSGVAEDVFMERKLISPASADKLLPDLGTKLNKLVSRSEAKPTIADQTDPRAEFVQTSDSDLA